jgi:DNA-3-methyladenine glycosylase
LDVARHLIGCILVHESAQGRLSGRIVETEAYVSPGDEASHAYRGETPRNRVMFGPAGHAYVYVSYGLHHMLNVVTEETGVAAAVLIRAVEPLEGIEIMARNRGIDGANGRQPTNAAGRQPARNLTNGPGRLCQAMAIGRALNGSDLTQPPLFILPAARDDLPLMQTTRIGITRSVELPWRFYLLGSPDISVRDRRAESRRQ